VWSATLSLSVPYKEAMKAALTLVLLVALCAVVSGCGSSHRTKTSAVRREIIPISSLPNVSGIQCMEVTFDRRTHKPKVKPVKCSGYHPVPAHKK
jgi:hypothetical protein